MNNPTAIRSLHLLAAALAAQAFVATPFATAQESVEVEADTVLLISNGVPAAPIGAPALSAVSVIGSDAGAVVTGQPYSADAVTTTTQQLADGNRITHRNEMRVYRDAEGRTRREHSLAPPGFAPQAISGTAMITINDPVAKTNFVLDPTTETVRRLPTFDVATAPVASTMRLNRVLRGPGPAGQPGDAGEPGETHVVVEHNVTYRSGEAASLDVLVENFTGPLPPPGPVPAGVGFFRNAPAIVGELETRTEDLGQQVLQGLRTSGTRVTRTIPAGAIGNERPIEIVSERWHSAELAVDVLRRNSDPRTGETLYELVNIDRSAPPADLFTVPGGYEETGAGVVDFQLQRTE
jgi:hypothetical protein